MEIFPSSYFLDKARFSLAESRYEKCREYKNFGEHLKSIESKEERKKRLLEACHEMEALFIYQMIRSMKETLNREENLLYGGETEEIFQEMLDHEYAKLMSQNGKFGLATAMYNQLSKYV
jgi:flagellar protein FlgJ